MSDPGRGARERRLLAKVKKLVAEAADREEFLQKTIRAQHDSLLRMIRSEKDRKRELELARERQRFAEMRLASVERELEWKRRQVNQREVCCKHYEQALSWIGVHGEDAVSRKQALDAVAWTRDNEEAV